MERFIIDERNGWEYELKGEQYYPTGRVEKNGVMVPTEIPKENRPEDEKHIGVWGQRRLRYIRQYKKRLYLDLYMSGKLNDYLSEINTQAEDMFFRLVKELSAQKGLTEVLKAKNQMLWVQHSNCIYIQAREIVNVELIYA